MHKISQKNFVYTIWSSWNTFVALKVSCETFQNKYADALKSEP